MSGSGGRGHGGRDRRTGRGAGVIDPGRAGATDPAARPHARRGGSGLQRGGSGISAAAPLTRKKMLPQAAEETNEDKRGECHRSRRQRNAGATYAYTTLGTYALSGTWTLAACTTHVVGNQISDSGMLWITWGSQVPHRGAAPWLLRGPWCGLLNATSLM